MMLKVQEYLLSHSLDDLAKEHGIYARFSTKNPNKFTLNYDMIEAKDGDPIAEECRGLVLEATCKISCNETPGSVFCSAHPGFGPTRILAFPFKRFYNHGQGAAANVDWNNAKFFEKLDGTLCIVYFDHSLGVWSVGTRSVPDADIPYENVTGKTFRELFAHAATMTYFPWEQNSEGFEGGFASFCDLFLVKKYTYMFELCTPENEPNCIRHAGYKIWLLAVRNNETLEEEEINHPDLIVCPSYDLTPESVFNFVLSRSHMEYEGLVIRDASFNRIKIKNPAYVLASKMKDSAIRSPRNLLEIILMEKDDDIRPLLPEKFQEELDKIKDKLHLWVQAMDHFFDVTFQLTMEAENQRKEFALLCKKHNMPIGTQMWMFSNKVENGYVSRAWIKSCQNEDGTWPNAFLDSLLKMIGA